MKDKIIAIIQARVGSTRLPNKVLLDLEGKTVLERVVERVKKSELVSDVIVATTVAAADLKITDLCASKGIKAYRGSENDVLDRYYQAAKLFEASHVVRITADCPLIDPKVIDDVLRLHLKENSDYTANILKETFPDGEDVEVFTFEALTKAWKDAALSSEREHVTPYMRNHPEIFKHSNLENHDDLSKKRWTLDTAEDYEFIKKIYQGIGSKKAIFGMKEVLELLKAHPEYEEINGDIKRNEGYLKSLREDKVIKTGYGKGGENG